MLFVVQMLDLHKKSIQHPDCGSTDLQTNLGAHVLLSCTLEDTASELGRLALRYFKEF